MFVCAYAPMANLSANRQDGDYAMELTIGGQRISNNGQENAFEMVTFQALALRQSESRNYGLRVVFIVE